MDEIKLKSFQDLLDHCGGVQQLCLFLNVHPFTVQRWARNGFPEKYIIPISDRYRLPAGELRKLRKRLVG
jgi:hypothetical protein